LVYAKSDAQVLCVDPALASPNVSLVTNALVKRLETDASGREVTRMIVERNGETATKRLMRLFVCHASSIWSTMTSPKDTKGIAYLLPRAIKLSRACAYGGRRLQRFG
jgi:hypothetical protein